MTNKDFIQPEDLADVAAGFNRFTQRADKDRLGFSKLLLTIYTPVSSGLLLLSTRLELRNSFQKVVFLIVATSAVLIVASALLEKYGYFRVSLTQAEKFMKHVRETGKALQKPIYGKKWENKLISLQSNVLISLLIINIASTLVAIYSFVLS